MERATQPPSRGTLVLKRYRAFPCHVERVIPGPPRRPSGRSALSRDQAAEDRGASCQATEQDSCFGPTYLGRSDHHTPPTWSHAMRRSPIFLLGALLLSLLVAHQSNA